MFSEPGDVNSDDSTAIASEDVHDPAEEVSDHAAMETLAEPSSEASDSVPSTDPSWLEYYEPVFANYRAVADADLNDFDYSLDTYRVLTSYDLTLWQDVTYGYALRDLDENGIPELIVGNMASEGDNCIHALFTLVDYEPYAVFFSITRDSYHLTSTGNIFRHGSGGAMLTDSMIYHYDGTTITPIYGCFTSQGIDCGLYDYGYYLVTNGDRYTGSAEMVSKEEFLQYLADLEATILPLNDLSPIPVPQ